MKKIKHFIQRKPLIVKGITGKGERRIYLYETKLQSAVRITKTILYRGMWGGIAVWTLLLAGAMIHSEMVSPEVLAVEKTVVMPANKELPPVLVRIMKCESGGTHYKNGQVLVRANKNGSTDTGIAQINSVWNKEATKQGLDLTKEEDNIAFAVWIYENKGTGDWSASQKCWKK